MSSAMLTCGTNPKLRRVTLIGIFQRRRKSVLLETRDGTLSLQSLLSTLPLALVHVIHEYVCEMKLFEAETVHGCTLIPWSHRMVSHTRYGLNRNHYSRLSMMLFVVAGHGIPHKYFSELFRKIFFISRKNIYFLEYFFLMSNFLRNPKIILRKPCEHYKIV